MHVLGYRLVVRNAEIYLHVISDCIGVFIIAQVSHDVLIFVQA